MYTHKSKELFEKFEMVCKNLNANPVICFCRGELHGRPSMMMLCGPTLDLEKLSKLRSEINEQLDAKESQLKGEIDPDTTVIHY